MGGPGRNEYGISLTLRNGVANHAILLEQARPQVAVEVDRLVVDGVVVRLQLVTLLDGHLVQEVSDLVGIPWVVDVPEGPHHHPFLLTLFLVAKSQPASSTARNPSSKRSCLLLSVGIPT